MVGVVLAVVVVVVMAAIVLAVCSTQQRRKRSGQTLDVPAVALSVADDSGIALIRNPAYDELKNVMSRGNEAGSVQYDYARPTDIAPGVMGHETSTHDAVLLAPMYEPMSDTPPAKVSINTHSCAMTIQHNRCAYLNDAVLSRPLSLFVSFTSETDLSFQIHYTACMCDIYNNMCFLHDMDYTQSWQNQELGGIYEAGHGQLAWS